VLLGREKSEIGMVDSKSNPPETDKNPKSKMITLPMTKKDVLSLHVGDMVLITGQIVTGRDKIHKFLCNEKRSGEKIPFNLEGTILYHCGPLVKKTRKGFDIIAAGPTTSMRVEMYEHRVISGYGLRGVMGKGGMGKQTLEALRKNRCVYLHTIGGAAVYLAARIKRVIDVWKLREFGSSDAMWLLEVSDFPAIVTMDTYGKSLHDLVGRETDREFKKLIR
jgi:tartrate/fumarate subfamily iron-sulfur-dependent hydro-lyase beta chain